MSGVKIQKQKIDKVRLDFFLMADHVFRCFVDNSKYKYQ